jgi:BirA family biotin operon repressor/biotin-[acetyl-CoA-carboxylase] ligase
LRPNVETRHSSLLNLAAALAARCAIEGFFPPGCGNIEIKWPNDILANGKKICGIICEAAGDAKRLGYAVLGIGINANGRAEDMQALGPPGKMKATSLMAELGHAVSLPELLAGVLNGLEEFSGMVEAEGDRARLIEIYRSRCSTVGRSVKIQSDEGEFTGTAIGVAEDGALVLKAESGEETAFRAADVIHATME